jgi:hypothetical protein
MRESDPMSEQVDLERRYPISKVAEAHSPMIAWSIPRQAPNGLVRAARRFILFWYLNRL